ncbi:MAG: serine/threonine protein kinase [Gammaproteobacteria bacterium]
MDQHSSHPYETLTPDRVLNSIEALGYEINGHLLALNSYENRVYQIGINENEFVIAKFYRPGRWSRETIQEEHDFSHELAQNELPVIAPFRDKDGKTLHSSADFLFSVSPRSGGHWPDLNTKEQREQMGRLLGRIHAIGALQPFQHRQTFTVDNGRRSQQFLLENAIIPDYLKPAYSTLTEDLLDAINNTFSAVSPYRQIRLHGDCHPGNILWSADQGPRFVDLDDASNGPAIQDLWMLLSGDAMEMRQQLEDLLAGYETFYDFDFSTITLIESLRTLRIMNYAAWLAQRWDDPAFQIAFPWFESSRYWEEHILSLREQAAELNSPSLL